VELFSNELQVHGQDLRTMGEDEVDWALAEYVLDLYEKDFSVKHFGLGALTIAAVAKAFPRHRLKAAWKVLDVWRVKHPPRQAATMPAELADAVRSWLVLAGQTEAACTVLLCFWALLRASEALKLKVGQLIFGASHVVIMLGATKRGLEDKVVVNAAPLVEWLLCYIKRMNLAADDVLIPISYNRLQRWLKKACAALGFEGQAWTSHSMRRGGATHLLTQDMPLSDIMLRGRWKTERSAREYLRRGELAITRLRNDIPASTWVRLHRFAALKSQVFEIGED